jgi:hypothetical protein
MKKPKKNHPLYKKWAVIPTKWHLTAAGSEGVEPQLGEEDINSMTIEELREFINKGVAPTAIQSGESNTDLVRFRKSNIANLKGTSGTVIFLLLPFSVDNDMIYFI